MKDFERDLWNLGKMATKYRKTSELKYGKEQNQTLNHKEKKTKLILV